MENQDENKFVRAVLLDSSPLNLCSTVSSNSILLETQISNPRTRNSQVFQTTSLIDSGCTALAFIDENSVVKRFNLPIKPLVKPRYVHLADGSSQITVTHYCIFRLSLGELCEDLVLFVTKLSNSNPIILGLPWLELHNPICN